MNKKFTSAILAGAMAISALGVSAFAAETTQKVEAAGPTTLKATAAFVPVPIEVVLPSTITAAINPYKIDYKFDNTAAGTSGVISPVYEIANNTADYGVKVAAKVWAAPAKTVTVATVDSKTKAAPTFKNDNTEDKTVFAYLNTTVAADKKFANSTYTADDATQVLFTEEEPENAVMLMQIAKATGKGYFQIQGDCVAEPAEKWDATDTVDLNIIFDINPYNDSAAGGSGGSTAPTGLTAEPSGGTATVSGTAGSYTATVAQSALGSAVEAATLFGLSLDSGVTVQSVSKVTNDSTGIVVAGTTVQAYVAGSDTFKVTLSNGTDLEFVLTVS